MSLPPKELGDKQEEEYGSHFMGRSASLTRGKASLPVSTGSAPRRSASLGATPGAWSPRGAGADPHSPANHGIISSDDVPGHGGAGWWHRFESAHFNDPLQEEPGDWRAGSHEPQHDVAAMHHPPGTTDDHE
jgi:hypothetical protein